MGCIAARGATTCASQPERRTENGERRTETIVEPRISLITLGTRDLARAIRFYRDGLGWPLSRAGGGDVAFFRTGGTVLALYPRDLLAEDAQIGEVGSGF